MIAEIEQELGKVLSDQELVEASGESEWGGAWEVAVSEDGIVVGVQLAIGAGTSASFSPFVVDLGAAGWLQGSSDGRRLSVAMSPSMKAAGVAIIGAVLRGSS